MYLACQATRLQRGGGCGWRVNTLLNVKNSPNVPSSRNGAFVLISQNWR